MIFDLGLPVLTSKLIQFNNTARSNLHREIPNYKSHISAVIPSFIVLYVLRNRFSVVYSFVVLVIGVNGTHSFCNSFYFYIKRCVS